MYDPSTICAISTPPGSGGIAVIRCSGEKSFEIVDAIFSSWSKEKRIMTQPANTLLVGTITGDSGIIDEVVVSLFRAPHSFTGEDIVEISCHGSVFIQQSILQLLISKGARMALPGEFTQRAFLNGKMDLSQAEAVADLIASTTSASHKIALKQMRGGFSGEIRNLREQLVKFTALIELELDFSEEDVEFADRTALKKLVNEIETLIRKLVESFRLGNAIKNGIPVVIAGETNVGKSTLLNALLNEEKAIVSDIHGTTRDVIEDVVNIHGTAFRFFDTAGIRDTEDAIENLGIERTFDKLRLAEIILLVVDMTNPLRLILERIQKIREKVESQHLIIVANKTDQGNTETMQSLKNLELGPNEDLVFISARSKTNLDELISYMQATLSINQLSNEDVIVTNMRHFEALTHAHSAILRVQEGLEIPISGDLLAQDIRECLHYLGSIVGDVTEDEVLGYIFKNFCIGK
jgi:tRNA modification GTPase